MSFLSSKPAVSQQPQELNSVNVDRSRYGDPMPLLYGTDRVPAMLGWYGAFSATAQTQASPGKGGGSKNITGYNYTASCVMMLIEGFTGGASISQVWKDKAITTLAAEGLTFFTGTPGQGVWPYLTTNFPSQAINYNLTAYVAAQNLNLGSSAALPNYTYEVHGLFAQAGIAITLTGGLSAGAISGTLSAGSVGLVANGVWDITFSDFETRSVTVAGSALTWDSAFPLTLAVTAAATIGGMDADPSSIWLDYCQDTNHGANFFLTDPGIQGAGATTWQTYCKANSLQLSVFEDTQRSASAALKDLLEITNSDCFLSANVLKISSYGDVAISGNGVTYTPNNTPLFVFTDDDYLPASEGSGGGGSTSDDPVQCIRKPLTETFNCVFVEYLDRSDNYNPHLAFWKDPLDIRVNGLRTMTTKTFHQIKIGSVAQQVATLIGQRQLYIRRQFVFSVRADLYTGLEPMDLIELNDSLIVGGLETRLGLINQLCRVVQTDDDENDVFTITCEEMLVGTSSAPRYAISGAQGFFANYAALPPSIAQPVLFPAPVGLTGGDFELWCAIGEGSAGGSYGGCNIYGSLDDVTWTFLGTVTGQARLGTVTTSHPIGASDSTIFLTMNPATDAAGYQLNSASASDFAANRALLYVDGEIIGFETVTLLSTAQYSVTVSRGLFGTSAVSHAVGASWCRLDPAIFQFEIDPGMIGQTIHIKGYSFNLFGQQTQTVATDFAFLIPNYQLGQVTPGPISFVGSGVMVAGTSAFKSTATNAWDSSCYSTQSYSQCNICCYPSAPLVVAGGVMVGLTTNPLASNSFTNLNYALYATSTGPVQIYELGTLVGTFASSYTAATLLNVVYDGKHISYYIGGTLVRTVPVAGLSLFGQICFFAGASDAVYGIDFGPIGTAVTPFTLTPMSLQVAASGTTAISNSLGTTAFGTRNFKSAESYNNGCQVSFGVNENGYDAMFLGLSAAPATGGTFGAALAAWYPHVGTSITEIIFNGASLGSFGAPATVGEVLTITYDNFTFRWWRGGALIHQEYFPSAGPLFLFGDMFDPGGEGFVNISFGPYGLATPQIWTARGSCFVSDEVVSKSASGASAWDSDAISLSGYLNCHLLWVPGGTTGVIGALTTGNPPATPGLAGLSYALVANSAGTLDIMESGTTVAAAVSTYNVNDVLSITYTGTAVLYKQNSTLLHTTTVTTGVNMFGNISIFAANGSVNNAEFGPGAIVPSIQTGKLAGNAATLLSLISTAGPVTITNNHLGAGITNVDSITIGPLPTSVDVVVTCNASWDYATLASGTSWYNQLSAGINAVSGTSGTNVIPTATVNSTSGPTDYNGFIVQEQHFTIGAGATVTYFFNAICVNPTGIGNFSISSVNLKVEVIKK